MFHSARIKLTAWYLLIIMSVSLAFSGVIYRMLMQEFSRFARAQRYRIERRIDIPLPQDITDLPQLQRPLQTYIDDALIEEVRRHILLILGAINASVFVFAGGLGYFLAGRTLRPIKDMVDEQHRFISDASHELRTPLTALKSSLEVHLRDPELRLADAKTLMKESIEDVDKLQSLSDALLKLAQYREPGMKRAFTRVQLTDIMKDVLKKVGPMARKKHITLKEAVSAATLSAYEPGLVELFVILVDNAVKYSPEHTTVTIRSERSDGEVRVRVTDKGIGISKKDLVHIFDRFYRADTARSKHGTGGYGLGLSIAKQIADMHHGSISAVSTPKKGSTFTVQLPVEKRNA